MLLLLGGWGEGTPVAADAAGLAQLEEIALYGAQIDEVCIYNAQLDEVVTYGTQLDEVR